MEKSSSRHPLTPPHSAEDWLSWLRLLRSRRVGVATFFRLMSEHGSADAALDALPGIAVDAGVNEYHVCSVQAAEAEMRAGQMAGARLVAFGSPDYPKTLSDISDPPPMIWARGDVKVLLRPMVALVGGRDASSLGTRMARKLAGALAEEGYVIVSGLARGIDTAAHLAALDRGTLAVMAGGVDVVYPAENAVLAQEIGEAGLMISERPMGLQPQARDFPRRNRIVAGLSRAVVVVEAAAKSGSLITARLALDQGREVMAVPGHPFDARAAGCNMLIRDGAVLVRSAADVIEALGPMRGAEDAPALPGFDARSGYESRPAVTATGLTNAASAPPPDKRSLAETSELHSAILQRLAPSPLAEDQLIRDLGGRADQTARELVTLELDGAIVRQSGGLIALAPQGSA